MTRLRRLDLPLCTKWWVRRSKVLIQMLCSSYYHGQGHGQGQAANWKTRGLRSPGSVQQANFISTSSNIRRWRRDGLPISLTKIMGYELSQFPASLFENEYLMLATNKPQIMKAFYKLEGADKVVQKTKFRVIKKSELTTL